MNFLFILIICSYIFIAYCENGHCTDDSGGVCNFQEENYYSQDMNNIKYEEILGNIHSANNKFVAYDSKNCSCFFSTLNADLKPFKAKGISEDLLTKAATKGTKYQIISHRLYREKNCMFPARCSGIEHFILKLISKLPDTEFILNTRDWPQILKNRATEPIPVFSFSKTNHYVDIMYPAWSFWEGGPAISLYPQGLGRWDQHRKSLSQTADKYPWQKKDPKAFFRGSRTSSTRDNIVLLSRKHPNLVDAQYTKNQAWKSNADTLNAPPAPEVSLEEHCKYRFLFNFRGVAASFRFKHLFLCKSLVFHIDDGWLEFFYSAMKPWVHYIPIRAESSQEELKDYIQFAAHNDDTVKEIAEEGYKFIWENLTMKNILCYWNTLLRKYTKLLTFTPKRDHNLIEIQHKR